MRHLARTECHPRDGKASRWAWNLAEGPGISIKLAALHPRTAAQFGARDGMSCAPRLAVARRCGQQYDIGLNIDAEDKTGWSCRSTCSRSCHGLRLAGWNGPASSSGHQTRACRWSSTVVGLAPAPIRLIPPGEGAYRQRNQTRPGRAWKDYPVYTRKVHTDVLSPAPETAGRARCHSTPVRHHNVGTNAATITNWRAATEHAGQ